ncbi:MAG: acyl carrier protein [Thermoguttaceae bacterium]|nr:acyl carrier protein [Thermoguttaceae bacterium]
MATQQEIADKIIEVIAEQLGREKDTITLESDITNDLGADSLDIAELMIAFEEEFDVDIEEDSAQNIVTVKDVIEQITALVNA